jgi:hypothetical protein
MMPSLKQTWPDKKAFAFTVFDDTDNATVSNVGEVYALLTDLGFRTTKSVWPSAGTQESVFGGATLADDSYLRWILSLRDAGFEIGYHMNTYHTSTRKETVEGLNRFRDLIGHDPKAMANHAACRENIYWSAARLSGWNRLVYNLATGFRKANSYRGHIEGDPLFWGDLCRDKIMYCRGFVLPATNTLRICPEMPYHDPDRPYVNYWFASSEGPEIRSFVNRISEAEQDQLEHEGGACIMYTHFASDFQEGRSLDPRFRSLMERLSKKNGWFVPVSTLLDYLREMQGHTIISRTKRNALERRWLKFKLLKGTS